MNPVRLGSEASFEQSRFQLSWGAPEVLYRAFQEEQYAKKFVEGKSIRLCHIRYFATTLESNIRDVEEGRILWEVEHDGQLVAGGGAVSPYPIYILSLAGPGADLDRLRRLYGRYVVRINDPARFAHDLAAVVGRPQLVDCVRVLYARPNEVPEPRTATERLRLIYLQKPREFALDDEYRIAVVASECGGGYLGYITGMKARLSYAEIL